MCSVHALLGVFRTKILNHHIIQVCLLKQALSPCLLWLQEAEQHIRRTGIRKDILVRRQQVEIKTAPQNLKKQKLATMNALRKQLRKKGVSKQEEKETLRQVGSLSRGMV